MSSSKAGSYFRKPRPHLGPQKKGSGSLFTGTFSFDYFCQTEDLARLSLPNCPGPSTEALSTSAKHQVVASLPYLKNARRHLSQHAVLSRKARLRANRRAIPDDPLYYDKFYFTPSIWVSNADTAVGNIGTLRWDQWFPKRRV